MLHTDIFNIYEKYKLRYKKYIYEVSTKKLPISHSQCQEQFSTYHKTEHEINKSNYTLFEIWTKYVGIKMLFIN